MARYSSAMTSARDGFFIVLPSFFFIVSLIFLIIGLTILNINGVAAAPAVAITATASVVDA